MLALIKFTTFLFFFAAESHSSDGHGGGGGFNEFYNTYLNYPGFEAWKFLNLFIFVGVLVWLLKKPLSDAFKAKREAIRQELIKAKEERDAALAKLSEVEARLAKLDSETAQIREQAQRDAELEAERIAAQTELDIAKLRENARREIEAAAAQAKRELKRFSAEESIRLAEEMLRQQVKGDDAARLVAASINGLGATNNGGAKR